MRTLFSVACLVVVAACAGSVGVSGEPHTQPTAKQRLDTLPPTAPGPCSSRNEAFAGVTETVYTYADGRRTRAVESGPAGQRQMLWSYDAAGRRKEAVVIDLGGITTTRFVYDRDLLVREDVFEGEQTQPSVQHRRRYEGGQLRERAQARFIDGAWVVVDTHALHYDDHGRFVYELRTRTPPGEPQTLESVTVETDARGRVVARRVDEGMDGTFERVSLFDYDDSGRLTTLTVMHGEALHSVSRHRYDDQGRMVWSQVEDGQGKPLSTTTYDFSCWDAAAPRG